MNYLRFFNSVSLARRPSPIRVLTAIAQASPPSMISMAGGLPNADLFPIKEASFSLSDGSLLKIDDVQMKKALQYSPTPGVPELREWIKTLQQKVHKPPTLNSTDQDRSFDTLIISGSQDGLCKAFEATVSPGDNVLLESPTYSGTLAIVRPLGANIIPVESDHNGLIPQRLQEILSKWQPSDAKDPQSNIPKILYVVPTGGNPTGHSLSLERKHEIYKIARDYNLLIIEDDPYYYLQFNEPYVPSFLSMDEDGRVLRFDSFSKLMSSGMRIGVLSGPKAVLDKVALHMQVSLLQTSTLTQIILLEVLKHFGHDGFLKHAKHVAQFYQKQCHECLKAAEKNLTGLAEWSAPTGGMFLWLKLLGIADTSRLITEKARAKEVLFVPGANFMVDESQPCPYVRASYSLCSPQDMDTAFQRLASLIHEEKL